MHILNLSLEGPQQSYGYTSRFPAQRDAGMGAPTLSAIVGMMASVCGVTRDQPERLHDLGFTDIDILVRIDQPGSKEQDFQTVVVSPPGVKKDTKLIYKEFYTDAKFNVGIYARSASGEQAINMFLKNVNTPQNAAYLGRKSYAPQNFIHRGIMEVEKVEDFFSQAPLLTTVDEKIARVTLTTVSTAKPGTTPSLIVNDIPISFESRARQYLPRAVVTSQVTVPNPHAKAEADNILNATANEVDSGDQNAGIPDFDALDITRP